MLILNTKLGQSAQMTIIEEASKLERRRQRRHEVWVITCYLQFSLVEKYVAELKRIIRVTDVFLAFEYSELLKYGASEVQEQLNTIREAFKGHKIDFEWAALRSTQLMHGKAYGVIQRSGEDIVGGFVLISSANFTKPGFYGNNVEIGVLLHKKKEMRAFEAAYDKLREDLEQDTRKAVFDRNSVLFQYALLSNGVFLHKWIGNLRQRIGIHYLISAEPQPGKLEA